ncbi:MAG: STAS domain-containing protein [Spirochaetia bacterium]
MGTADLEALARATRGMKHFLARASVRDEGLVIHLEGYLDEHAARASMPVVLELIEKWEGRPMVVFVLDKLEYISSLGVGLLTSAKAVARQRGFAHLLENPQPAVRNVLEVLGMFAYLSVQDRPSTD